MDLCQYRDIFGIPGLGAHSYRIFNIAIIDVILTIVGAYLLARYFKWNFWYTLIALYLIGIFLHWLFCVRTSVNILLGLI